MKALLFVLPLAILFAISCKSSSLSQERYKVEHKGALKNMMHLGDLSSKIDLSKIKKTEHLYALGAVENLKGEVLILNGKPFISSVKNKAEGSMKVDNSYQHKAALFVYANVQKWKSSTIPASIVTYEHLEKYIEETAKKEGLDTEKPFPFLMEGSPKSIEWHVIDWKDGDTEHSHEKHIHSGLFGTMENPQLEILGFYSKSHHTIFTHHSTNMHLHFKTTDDKLAGHLDGIIMTPGMILKLPDLGKPRN